MKTTNDFSAITYSVEDLCNIERTARIFSDSRSNNTNARTTIYEVEKFIKYVCVIKQHGEYKRYLVAQNALAILLNL